jgi:hypothetical protein
MKNVLFLVRVIFVVMLGGEVAQASSITVNPTSLDFGLVAQGKGHGVLANVKNSSSNAITCTASVQPASFFSLVGADGNVFSSVASASIQVPANNQKPLDVAFKSGNSSIGSVTQGTLSISCPAGNNASTVLRGQTGVELEVTKSGNLAGNLIVTSNGAQLLTCGANLCTLVKDHVIQVTISADPSSSFAGWSNATSGAASCWGQKTPCQFSLNANTNIMGTFGTKR